jgi:hypothetical protein
MAEGDASDCRSGEVLVLSAGAVRQPQGEGGTLDHGEIAFRRHKDLVHWEETKVGLPGGAELIRMVRQLRLQSLALTSDTK